jgi:ATP-dependent phosphofructokinase / diphosphate-dependent phosphofructokinase
VPLASVAGKNRLVPLDHPLIQAAQAMGISMGRPFGL